MNRNFFIAEKVISTLLIIWGGLSLYFITVWVKSFFDLGLIEYVSFSKFCRNYHLIFLIPLVTLVGGTLLLFNKRIGWVISLITLLLNTMLSFIPVEKGKSIFDERSLILFFAFEAVLFLIMFCILVQPIYRNKYNSTKGTWWTIGLIALLILLDKTFLYLIS
jgi:Na+-translocating ferredoxin:NAD+ oxidoreductase RnfD subunit